MGVPASLFLTSHRNNKSNIVFVLTTQRAARLIAIKRRFSEIRAK